jgi:hypothetical protein
LQSEIAVPKPKPIAAPKFVDSFSGRVSVSVASALVGGVIAAWSPFWPTAPEIEAGVPSLGSAFDIPFTIFNRSKFFSLTNFKISCEIVEAVTPTNAGVSNVALVVDASNYIGRAEVAIYTCPLNRFVRMPAGSPIERASIRFRYSYSQSILWSETAMFPQETKEFRLLTKVSPLRWTSERSLN